MGSGSRSRQQTSSSALSRSTSRVSSTLLPVVLALILLPGFGPREIAAADPGPFGERNLAQSSDGPQPP